ncbi:MAG: dihydropteroate synthase [Desulfobacteraceae bacterium IS3]|nr:MAG: dihydropteroate synthase [Desulfobacteraceae bacterium IS3]
MKTYHLSYGKHRLELGTRTLIMGILNITPDSFSDGGKFFDTDIAVAQGEKMVAEGADILDIGGESTRPFSEAVSEEEETDRVLPVIEKLVRRVPVPISIDTSKAGVARRAIRAGAAIINDISALRLDPYMSGVASEYGVPVILMHMKGTPRTMQTAPVYENLIGEVRAFFENAVSNAEKSGISRSKLIIDPGIGFGKTLEHNLLLIRHLREFESFDLPLLIGVSRKAFIRNLLKDKDSKEADPLSPEAEIGTQAAVAAAILNGAHIVRVHNAAATRATAKIADAIRNIN